jgi:hypothetical protein
VIRTLSVGATTTLNKYRKVMSTRTILLTGLILLVLMMALQAVRHKALSSSNPSNTVSTLTEQLNLDRHYILPALDPTTNTFLGEMDMTVVNVSKMSEIWVKGAPVQAGAGKAFLVINLELQNQNTANLGFFARDYIRLIVDTKPYAPDFFNQGVVVAPVSVKTDRVSFVIEESLREINLRIGDLQTPIETVSVSFSR